MRFLRLLLLLCVGATTVSAQAGTDVFARARRLVNEGDARAGRALVDSALAAATAGSPAYAEALYWRGVLAEEGEAARTDLLRVAIEFPLSPRASDALLRLAQLEFTRGDRAAAQRHLDRLEREHREAPSRAAGRYWTGRLLLEDSKSADACVALRDARRLAPASDVELLNQIAYYARPCDVIEMDAKARADSVTADSTRKAAERQAAAAKGRWSVQLAAYSNRTDALALVKRLTARGVDARVTQAKPWRVRVGHYVTRAEAAEQARKLGTARSKALVVEAEDR
ncbi:MAG: SPOR domain-containing protein [Gemmatimonadaceae bacterium]|nr:SPOR domain-containing protein [Gemmatimonadaceae bacterium]